MKGNITMNRTINKKSKFAIIISTCLILAMIFSVIGSYAYDKDALDPKLKTPADAGDPDELYGPYQSADDFGPDATFVDVFGNVYVGGDFIGRDPSQDSSLYWNGSINMVGGESAPTTSTTLPYSPTPHFTMYEFYYTNAYFNPRSVSPTSFITTVSGVVSTGNMQVRIILVDKTTGNDVQAQYFGGGNTSNIPLQTLTWTVGVQLSHQYYFKFQVFTQGVPGSFVVLDCAIA
jgi:hypothetical protein